MKHKQEYCAPAVKKDNGTCFDLNTLIQMIEIYNKKNPKNPILFESNAEEIIKNDPKNYKLKLLQEMNKRFSDECEDQKCWITHSIYNNGNKIENEILKIRHKVFKPERPKGKEWLSNFDIGAVLNQYEKKHQDFHSFVYNYDDFLKHGYSMPDFKELENRGKTKLGYVYNTGSHWIPIFIDLAGGRIYNFDSRGSDPYNDIPEMIKRAKLHIIKKKIEPEIIVNNDIYQLGNDECGVYSIVFIIKMLEGMSYQEYTKWLTEMKGGEEDEGISKMRDYFFTTYDKKKIS